ncbi:MAG: hypothetical protein COV44_00455 [Deltaproteobacteria bacterium CG11_big_fil_rev_8_21_14_0_20_45_16]|nr:MAG: hypothetical protein COV44_00455 [Deltaproteobacteria bacterium CG11_big_fil_rev_8_21_14_0_20_45_16]
MSIFNLPELGEGLEEGEIVGWKVKEGDSVKADQSMVEVMTDKATIEVPAPATGVVKKLYYKVGQVAKVGQALIEIAVSGAQESKVETQEESKVQAASMGSVPVAARPMAAGSSPSALSPVAESSGPQSVVLRTGSSERVLASPAVRKMAREMGVELTRVQGSGDRGRVLRVDLETNGSQAVGSLHALAREERIPFVGVRRKIAESLSRSMHTAVHFTHHDEADFSEVMKLKDEANQYSEGHGLGVKVTYLPFFVKAAIAGLKQFPILNSTLDEKTNEIVIKRDYHFGFSVQTPQGLMVAVVRDCDRKSIFEIAKDLREVVDRARNNKASLQDLTGSTITITSVGNIGGLHATPVINFPEVAILGMYQIKKRPVVKEIDGEDQIVIRPMMYVNITCDHRIVDGAVAAEFMRLICDYLENPGRLAFFA